jgi:lipopolysaccharide export LptBFGC system permease protein LptF
MKKGLMIIIVFLITMCSIFFSLNQLLTPKTEYKKVSLKIEDKNISIPRGYKVFQNGQDLYFSKGACLNKEDRQNSHYFQSIFQLDYNTEENKMYSFLIINANICFETNEKGNSSLYLNPETKKRISYKDMSDVLKNLSVNGRRAILKEEEDTKQENILSQKNLKSWE